MIAEGQGNLPVYYTEDLFAADRECGASYAEYRFPKAARCISGNFTQSVYEPLGSFGLDGDCEVMDAHVTSAVDGVTYDRGKWVLTGESRVGLLMRTGDEYATHDLLLPFRYETDGEGGEPMLTAADVQTVSVRSRVDGGRLGLECEMAVSARICVAQKLVALSEAVFGETLEKPAEMVVAFPERGETLWSLAKRYHTPIAALAKLNATPSNPLTVLKAGEPMVVNE